MTKSWIQIVNELVVERGVKRDGVYRATITSREVLERAGAVITPANHRNVRAMVEMNYPKTALEADSHGAQYGFIFHMRVRSK